MDRRPEARERVAWPTVRVWADGDLYRQTCLAAVIGLLLLLRKDIRLSNRTTPVFGIDNSSKIFTSIYCMLYVKYARNVPIIFKQ